MAEQYKKLFMIGEAASIANISRKQLRHYDELGIFSPAYKDPETGYRYYTEDQLRDIFTIRDFRFLGMSLQEIGEVLTDCQDIYAVAKRLEDHQKNKRMEISRAQYELAQTNSYLSRIREALQCRTDTEIKRVKVAPFSAICETIMWDAQNNGYKTRSWLLSDLLKKARERHMDTRENFILLHGDYMRQFGVKGDKRKKDSKQKSFDCAVESTIGWVVEPGDIPEKLNSFKGFDAISLTSIGTDADKEGIYGKLISYASKEGLELGEYALERHIIGSSVARSYDKRIIRIYLSIKSGI